jgi:hypothetical protein
MAAGDGAQLSGDICGSRLLLFLGAGASVTLGLRLMGPFMELLEQDMGSALLEFMGEMFKVPGAHRDLEILFETIEKYESTASWCAGQPAWKHAISTQQFSDFLGNVKQIKRHASDLVVSHYSQVDPSSALRLYKDFLLLLLESNSPRHLPVFTTNYDTAIEDFVDAAGDEFQLLDGFSSGSRREWSPEILHKYRAKSANAQRYRILLFKLHGSSTWRVNARTRKYTKESTAEPAGEGSGYENALVWPGLTKTIKKGPYETHYAYLEKCLRHAQLCVVVGFSFRDERVLAHFMGGLEANQALRIAVIDPNAEAVAQDRLGAKDFTRVRPIARVFDSGQLAPITSELAKITFPWAPGNLVSLTAQPD